MSSNLKFLALGSCTSILQLSDIRQLCIPIYDTSLHYLRSYSWECMHASLGYALDCIRRLGLGTPRIQMQTIGRLRDVKVALGDVRIWKHGGRIAFCETLVWHCRKHGQTRSPCLWRPAPGLSTIRTPLLFLGADLLCFSKFLSKYL